jgi:hypothetical protein
MKQRVRFRKAAADREATTRTLIADLYRIVAVLDADIAAEEEQIGVIDLTRPEYPILARKLRGRRDNLLETVSQLRQRLAAVRADIEAEPTIHHGSSHRGALV